MTMIKKAEKDKDNKLWIILQTNDMETIHLTIDQANNIISGTTEYIDELEPELCYLKSKKIMQRQTETENEKENENETTNTD